MLLKPDSGLQVEQYLAKAESIHEDFRLWITAEPHPLFPIGLLQMGREQLQQPISGDNLQWEYLDIVLSVVPQEKLTRRLS